jgi:hypothetical protein
LSKAVKDKWRRKEWFDIILPRYFGETKVGETPAEEGKLLQGRVFETTLAQITGDFSQEYIKMYFQVTGVDEHKAQTIFKGHVPADRALRTERYYAAEKLVLNHAPTASADKLVLMPFKSSQNLAPDTIGAHVVS